MTISVLIPALNEADRLPALIRRLQELGFDEVVVADGGSGDGTAQAAATVQRTKVVAATGGRGPSINAAAAAATGTIFFILHADSWPPDDAPRLIAQTLARPGISGGCFRLAFDQKSIGLNLCAWFSRFETALTTFGDQGLFIGSATFQAIGGAPSWPLLEDVELRRRIKRHGCFVKLKQSVVTSARRFERLGVLQTQLRNLAILSAFWSGVSPQTLSRWYRHPMKQKKAPPVSPRTDAP